MTVEEWLIDAIKIRPIIWNTKDENYKNIKLKNAAYEEIAKDSNLTVNEIKRKWHSIRSAFSRELRMRNLYSNVSGNGNSSSNNEKRVWKHFNKLVFLQEDGCSSESELDGNMDNDYTTIAIISEDNLINNNNNTMEYSQSSSPSNQNATTATNSSNSNNNHNNNCKPSTNKKRKTTNQNNSSQSSSQFNSHQNNNSNGNNFQSKFRLSEEEIFGHSIAASLRKFDPKKQEIVKLRLQEVIVQHLSED